MTPIRKFTALLLFAAPVLASDGVLTWDPVDMGPAVPIVYNVYRAELQSTNWVKMATVSSPRWAFSGTNVAQLAIAAQYNWPDVIGPQPESLLSAPVIFYPSLNTITNVRVTIIVTPNP